MSDQRYDLVIEDPGSNERLSLVLAGPLTWASAEQMAQRIVDAKTAQDFDAWSVVEQADWHGGRAKELWDSGDPARFYDSLDACTWIQRQLTLGPLPYSATLGGTIVDATGATSAINIGPTLTYKKLAQSFTCGAHTCSSVSLFLRRGGGAGGSITVRIETDAGGLPSGVLAGSGLTATVSATALPDPGAWYDVAFPSGVRTLSASTTYWLVVDASALTVGWVSWTCRYDSAYASGSLYQHNGSAWSLVGPAWDGCFQLPAEAPLAGTVNAFATSDNKVYCGAGKAVYQWDSTTSKWVVKKSDFANNVSAMADFAGALWIAQTDGNLWTYDGASWVEKTGTTANQLTVYKGYLYRSTQNGTDNLVYCTADGTTWSYAWKVGNYGRGERITGMTGYAYDLYVATSHGLYRLGPETDQGDLVDQIKSWASQADSDNGRGLITWARDGRLYVPVLHSLVQYQEGLLASVGPDEEAGLPDGRSGNITAMVSLTNWLVAALDAGAGTSSVLLYNGLGWHEAVRCPVANASCRAIAYDTTTSPHRLWFGYGNRTGYIQFPDTTDNPYQAPTVPYAVVGELITPWFGSDLLLVDKDLLEVGVVGECPDGASVEVFYECDKYGGWASLGTLSDAVVASRLPFPWGTPYATPPVVVSATPTVLTVNSAAAVSEGDWVRVGEETRQVSSVSGADITLVTALSEAPAAGAVVYASKPVAKSFRLRLVLTTTRYAVTPKIEHVWVKYMPMLRDKRAGSCVVELTEEKQNRAGVRERPDYESQADLMRSFCRRATPLNIYDREGNLVRAKISNWQEVQGPVMAYSPAGPQPVVHRFTLSMLEI